MLLLRIWLLARTGAIVFHDPLVIGSQGNEVGLMLEVGAGIVMLSVLTCGSVLMAFFFVLFLGLLEKLLDALKVRHVVGEIVLFCDMSGLTGQSA